VKSVVYIMDKFCVSVLHIISFLWLTKKD
jgi:hypothetical protein